MSFDVVLVTDVVFVFGFTVEVVVTLVPLDSMVYVELVSDGEDLTVVMFEVVWVPLRRDLVYVPFLSTVVLVPFESVVIYVPFASTFV